MRGWGVMFVILGAGSFILPYFGIQFKILSIMGEATPYVAAGLAVLGLIMVFAGGGRRKAEE